MRRERELAVWKYEVGVKLAREAAFAEGEAAGVARGETKELNETIRRFCDAFDIAIAEQRGRVAGNAADTTKLRELLDHIVLNRKWPKD